MFKDVFSSDFKATSKVHLIVRSIISLGHTVYSVKQLSENQKMPFYSNSNFCILELLLGDMLTQWQNIEKIIMLFAIQ